MPFVKINLNKGYSSTQKNSILEKTSQALIETAQAKAESIHIIISEIDAYHCWIAGQPSEYHIRYEIDFKEGRTAEQKKELIKALYENARDILNTPEKTIHTILRDNQGINFSGGFGQSL